MGSVIGVLATGYLLLPQLGISGTLLVGVALIALALIGVNRFRTGAALGAGCVLAIAADFSAPDQPLMDASDGYHRIRVIEEDGTRSLLLDNTLEGRVRLPRYVKHLSPETEVRVAEVDPDVVRVAVRYLAVASRMKAFT